MCADEGGISAPTDFNAWFNFIQEFTQALVTRYGLAEVSQWKFEVRQSELSCVAHEVVCNDVCMLHVTTVTLRIVTLRLSSSLRRFGMSPIVDFITSAIAVGLTAATRQHTFSCTM